MPVRRGSAYSQKKKKEAFARTLKWEERSLAAWKELKSKQALYGIVQGDTDKKLRRQSLKFNLELGFPGLAMGGESIGKDPAVTAETLDTVADLLPDNKPLHGLGLGGGPEGIFAAVARGVDTFDNTSVTRLARTGLVYIYPQDGGRTENKFRLDITKSQFKDDKKPLSKVCGCYGCKNFSKAYLAHLIVSGEILGLRLCTIHNIYFVNNLMNQIRDSIISSDFRALKKFWLGK